MNVKIAVKVSKEDVLTHLRRVVKEGENATQQFYSKLKGSDLGFTETLVDYAVPVIQKTAPAEIASSLVSAIEAGRWKLDELATYSVQEAMRHLGSLYGSQSTNRMEQPKRAAQGYFWSELARVLSGLG